MSAHLLFTAAKKKEEEKGSGWKVRTQDPENFDEEVKSLGTARCLPLESTSFCLAVTSQDKKARKGNVGEAIICHTIESWRVNPVAG